MEYLRLLELALVQGPSVQLRMKRLEIPALDRVKGEQHSSCGLSTLDPVFEEQPGDVDSIHNGADDVSSREPPWLQRDPCDRVVQA